MLLAFFYLILVTLILLLPSKARKQLVLVILVLVKKPKNFEKPKRIKNLLYLENQILQKSIKFLKQVFLQPKFRLHFKANIY